MADGIAQKIGKNAGFVGSVMMSISLVLLIDEGFDIGWAKPFARILEQYEIIIVNIDDVMKPIAQYVIKMIKYIVHINIALKDGWPNIFLLSIIYLGSRVKSYASSSKYYRSIFMAFIACIASLIACVEFNLDSPKPFYRLLAMTIAPIVGFLIYDLIYSIVGATFDRIAGERYITAIIRHLKFSLPIVFSCLIMAAISSYACVAYFRLDFKQSYIVSFCINYFVIFAMWLFSSFRHASEKEHRRLGESVRSRMMRSSATNVAINVGIVIFSAAVFMLGNAGLKTLPPIH